MTFPHVAVVALLLTSGPPPQSPPYLACNAAGSVCAIIDLKHQETTVVRRQGTGSTVLWSIPEARGTVFVSDDGRYILLGADRRALAVKWFHADDIYLTFASATGKTFVRLRDLFPNLWDSKTNTETRDASEFEEHDHMFYHWGDLLGFDAHGGFRVRLLKRGVVIIDPATGKIRPGA
jgi:hypothetical protein